MHPAHTHLDFLIGSVVCGLADCVLLAPCKHVPPLRRAWCPACPAVPHINCLGKQIKQTPHVNIDPIQTTASLHGRQRPQHPRRLTELKHVHRLGPSWLMFLGIRALQLPGNA